MQKIYGRRPVVEALESDQSLDRVYIQDSISGEFEKLVRKLCKAGNVPLKRIPKVKLDREVQGNHQGIFAVTAAVDYVTVEDLLDQLDQSASVPVVVMLDGVMDVRNVGAIARSAEVFGAQGLIVPSRQAAPISEAAIRASSGALLHLPICRTKNLHAALDVFCARDYRVLGADSKAEEPLDQVDLTGPIVLVMGSEGKGIDPNLRIYFDAACRIPQAGQTQSLNVSVAAGIILYEVFKQRNQST